MFRKATHCTSGAEETRVTARRGIRGKSRVTGKKEEGEGIYLVVVPSFVRLI